MFQINICATVWILTQQQRTLTVHCIWYLLLVLGRTSFAFRSALILHDTDSTSSWKHSSEIWVRTGMIALHSCCKTRQLHFHVDAIAFHQIQNLDCDLVTVEATWVQWGHCHVHETSLMWFKLYIMVILSCWKESSQGGYTVSEKSCGPKCAKKKCSCSKSPKNTFLPIWFERVVLTMASWLNALSCRHVIGELDICFNKQLN